VSFKKNRITKLPKFSKFDINNKENDILKTKTGEGTSQDRANIGIDFEILQRITQK